VEPAKSVQRLWTYISIKKKNICDIATTPPIKKPTAMELWNFLMIMVPPILNANNINADHIDVNASLTPRVDITAHDMRAKTPVKPRMEYLCANSQGVTKMMSKS
jgi:hypothetical protein